VRERLPRYLLATGTLVVVIGIIVTTVLVVRRDDCNGVSPRSVCQGYTTGIHWAYSLIVFGAGFFLAAALAATKLVQHGHRTHTSAARHDEHAQNAR
jgi:hypothetical protein